jgi:primosomal protein N' (replication factor Y)
LVQKALFQKSAEESLPGGIAKIAVDLPLAGAFEYRIPARLRDKVEPGVRVWVSFSRRRMMGICFEVVDTPTVPNLLEIISVVEEKPLLSSNLIRLVRWMSDYYYCTLAEAALTALPRVARKGATGRKVQTARLGMPPAEAGSNPQAAGGIR